MAASRLFAFEDRQSDSPFVDRVWRAQSERGGYFTSIAMSQWEMVVSKYHGQVYVSVRGPETRPTILECPEGGDWLGIRFKAGTFIPELLPGMLVNRFENLPTPRATSFQLRGSSWDLPDFENADILVRRLVREDVIVRNRLVGGMLDDRVEGFSARTARRHFASITGLTPTAVHQIERARFAGSLLLEGMPIADVVAEAGYFDQPHLTRSLKRYLDRTPAQMLRGSDSLPLSLLYKTAPPR